MARTQAMPIGSPKDRALEFLIDSIGSQRFEFDLFAYINRACGIDHCALYQFHDAGPRQIGAASVDGSDTAHRQMRLYLDGDYWRRDPSIDEAQRRASDRQPIMIRFDPAKASDVDFYDRIYGAANVCDRVLVCGVRSNRVYGISILRSRIHGAFSAGDLAAVGIYAGQLLSAVAKHAEVAGSMRRPIDALISLPAIETCIVRARAGLTKRETEVCSRMLYGLSTNSIAVALEISEESVITYRKRAFQRIGIGSRRELLLWYLKAWSEQPAELMYACRGNKN